jgi:hypothetical protein
VELVLISDHAVPRLIVLCRLPAPFTGLINAMKAAAGGPGDVAKQFACWRDCMSIGSHGVR